MHKAYKAWQNAARLRSRRLKFKRYTFGDQWGDIVTDASGFPVTEREASMALNYSPATNNIIRQLVKTVVGCYRSARKEAGDTDTRLIETDARTFEEYLISGCAIQRLSARHLDSDSQVVPEPVSPARFFIGSYSDLHASDVELLGQLHDLSLQQVLLRHSHGDRERAMAIKRLYESDYMQNRSRGERFLGESCNDTVDFYHADAGLCRVIEMWSLEPVERLRCHDEADGSFLHRPASDAQALRREQKRRAGAGMPPLNVRWELTTQWRCHFFAPTGEIIDSYTAPGHPYVFKFYPLIDGEIHSFVEDIIEQQRNINRLLTLNDRLLSTAAKGVLLFPENQLSRDMPLDVVADRWASPDGCVVYRGMPGMPGPQQMIASPGNLGVSAMVEQQMRLIAEVSGVSDAMRGATVHSSGSASLYDSEHRNSIAALADIFDSFGAFVSLRDSMLAGCLKTAS